MKKSLPIMIIILLIVAAGSFYGGMKYQASKKISVGGRNFAAGQIPGGTGTQRFGVGQNGNNFVSGDILSIDNSSLTIKLRDGGSKIVLFSSSTPVMAMTTSTVSTLQTGLGVTITGTTNSDGSLTAQSIQVRPGMPGGLNNATSTR